MGQTKEILEKQLQLLSERSHQIANNTERGKELPLLTDVMIKLAVILEPEIQSELFPVAPLPLSERLTIADTEALAIGRRELTRRATEEAQRSWNDLREQLNQQQEENLRNRQK